MNSKFGELVQTLEPAMLEELRRAVAAEIGERRNQTALQIESIHPMMTAEQKAQAVQEIARALKGDVDA
ncbi:MAG: hypothetical protein ABL995_04825 [Bryobacteraceae bacterium]